MILPQVAFGSLTGSRLYSVIASSDGVTSNDIGRIDNFSNLAGSAQHMTEAARTYAFYPLEGDERWAFAETTIFGHGKRGNEYFVHVLVLHRDAMVAIGADLFALVEACAFQVWKPTDRRIDRRTVSDLTLQRALRRPLPAVDAPVAPLITALTSRRVAVCVDDVDGGRAVCETVHRTLPPADRARISFCTFFSYAKVLPFDLVAFVPADNDLVTTCLIRRGVTYFDPSSAASAREVEVWVSGRETREPLWGISVLTDVRRALAVEERLASWYAAATAGRATAEMLNGDVSPVGRDASAVLRLPENAASPSARGLATIIPALQLLEMLRSIAAGAAIDVSQLANIARSLPNDTIRWLFESESSESVVMQSARVIAWLAVDEDTIYALNGRSAAAWFRSFHAQNARAALELLTHLLRKWRALTGTTEEAVDFVVALRQDSDLLRTVIAAAEGASDRDGDRWLLSIIREILQLQPDLPPTALARIALDKGLLPELEEDEVALVLPELLMQFGSRFYGWAQTVADPRSFRAHAVRAATALLLRRNAWRPYSFPFDAALIAWFSASAAPRDHRDSAARMLLLWVASLRLNELRDRVQAREVAKTLAASIDMPRDADSVTHQLVIRAAVRLREAGAEMALPASVIWDATRWQKASWRGETPLALASLATLGRLYALEASLGAAGVHR